MDKQSFRLMPIYNPIAVIKTWSYYQEGVEAVLENSGSDTSMEKIYNDLTSGQLLLWAAFVDGKYAGFVTTRIVDTPPAKKHLWIVHAYKKVKVDSRWLLESVKKLEEFARQRGCNDVKFYAKEKPWQAKLIKMGYKPGYIEYTKEVANEDLS